MVRRMVRSFAKFEMAVHWVGVSGTDDCRSAYLWSMLA